MSESFCQNTSDIALQVADLSVHYLGQEKWVLDGVDLTHLVGKVSAVVGPSGCGKTTLVRAICGLVPHSLPSEYQGSVKLAGIEIADASVGFIASEVAYVGQNPDAAVITRTVRGDIAFALQNLCLPAEEIETRVCLAAKQVGLLDRLADDPWTLSGGQRQRLAIAVVLAMRPKLLVLDEPTSNIDVTGRIEFYRLIRGLIKQGMGVVVIDHDLDPILEFCDNVVALDADGKQIASGSPREVFFFHTEELTQCGIWLPRALRAGKTGALTCQQAGIEMPKLSQLCGPNVRYWQKTISGWTDVQTIEAASDSPIVELTEFGVAGRCPNISMSLSGGEFVAVIGENGAGKTSLLSAIAGMLSSTGCGQVNGKALRKGRHQVGYVFQNPEHQMVSSSVEKELSVGSVTADSVEKLLERFGLERVRNQHPLTLSGGQQRRLSVATMLAEQRNVIVLDEPTYGQDWANTVELMAFIKTLCAQGHTVLMATHDLELALENASHIIALPAGEKTQLETKKATKKNKSSKGIFASFNPVTLFLALLPLMVAIFILKQSVLNFAVLGVSSLLICCALASRSRTLLSVIVPWILTAILLLVFSDANSMENMSKVYSLGSSYAAASGVGALVSLVLLSGIAADAEELLVTLSTTFKMPYRITSAGTAAVAFVTRFRHDFRLLRTAKALRGVGNKYGFAAPAARWFGSFLPLAILAVQHGERVALSMDSRGFGAYPRRTELVSVPWRLRDWVLVGVLWAGTAALCWWF